jgi:hypothetical protein
MMRAAASIAPRRITDNELDQNLSDACCRQVQPIRHRFRATRAVRHDAHRASEAEREG